MKVEIVSRADISAGLVWDMIRDGVEVHYNGVNKNIFGGFPLFVRTDKYDDVDYYIFDDTMFGVQIEKMRKDGKYVVGGNKYGDRLELDRKFFFDEMKRLGINVPDSFEFSKVSDGMDWLDGKDGRYVFKPSGKISDIKSLTYVSKDVDDLLDFMAWVKEKYGDNIKYVLQEYIDGEEVAISGIVVDGKVVGGYFLNFEYKPFMRYSNLNTGEMGTVIKWLDNVGKMSDVFDRVVSELGVYRGWFDLNGILKDGEWYLLESTSRFGIPFFSIADDMIDMDVGRLYYEIAKGELDGFDVSDKYYVGLVFAGAPYPYDIKVNKEYTQKPIKNGLFEDDNVHYFEIMIKDDEYYTSGDFGYIAVVNGYGLDVKSANRMAVSKCRRIDIPNTFFRFDVGLDGRVERVMEEIL